MQDFTTTSRKKTDWLMADLQVTVSASYCPSKRRKWTQKLSHCWKASTIVQKKWTCNFLLMKIALEAEWNKFRCYTNFKSKRLKSNWLWTNNSKSNTKPCDWYGRKFDIQGVNTLGDRLDRTLERIKRWRELPNPNMINTMHKIVQINQFL